MTQAVMIGNSPRNHWLHLAQAMDLLHANDPRAAWRVLSALRRSEMLPPEVLAEAMALATEAMKGVTLLDLPADYLRRQPGGSLPRPLTRFNGPHSEIVGFPKDMILPPLVGSGNDFGFISDAAKFAGFTGPIPNRRLRLVFHLNTPDDVDALAQHLTVARPALQRLPAVDVVVFCPATCQRGQALDWPITWLSGTALTLSQTEQTELLAEGADLITFIPVQALADRLFLERLVRFNALNDRLCVPLLSLAEACGQSDTAAAHSFTALSESHYSADWRKAPFAFRRLDTLCFAIPASLFARIGGFTPRFRSAAFAVQELAFRAWNAGAYIMPIALRAELPESKEPDEESSDDKALLMQLCPHPWERKDKGIFEVPKVSIYIPAFRAGRYLGDAIDSVLSQDFTDLEVCVADDGSPDDTLKLLESYEHDPRVRWEAGVNGGIGHASNRAIRMTRGIYIGQLDSDDRLKPGAVRRLAEYLDENSSVGCVYGSCERIDAMGNWVRKEYSHPDFSRSKMMITSIAHHFRMFRRQVWMRTEGFREDIVNAVDYDMFLKMSEISYFHHLDEVMYQRRWHGQNTSFVNETFQTRNTYVVQRHSLERQGLDAQWDVHIADPMKPREVTYRRTGRGERVFFWPDYSRSNPYQRLLYSPCPREVEFIGTTPDALLRLLRSETKQENQATVFHIHWLNEVFAGVTNVGEAVDAAERFLKKLSFLKFAGVRIVWTVHNVVAHDTAFSGVEIELARRLIDLADSVHIHCAASLPEIEKHYQIPRGKLHVARHGAYVGAYPDFVTRDQARDELGIAADDEVMLFLGQIRPYKGMSDLLQVFRALLPERPRLRLVLAGAGTVPVSSLLDDLAMTDMERERITVINRFLDDSELQIFFRAADFTVFPYRNILTSGSLLLALSFGVPTLITDYAMPAQLLRDGRAGIAYAQAGGISSLSKAAIEMLQRLDSGQRPAMQKAALEIAHAETWEDIYPILFGGTEPSKGMNGH